MNQVKLPLFVYALSVCIFLSSCVKENPEDETTRACNNLQQLRAHAVNPVLKGETISLDADYMEYANYYWTGPGNFQSYTMSNGISYADYSDRGWYYVRISYEDCDARFDSVYVDVKFPQGTANCALTNNMATFNSALIMGDQSYYSVFFGAVMGGYGVSANSSNGDIDISMSPYWLTHDLEDGIYYTTSDQILEYSEIDKVFISDVNQSIYWVARPDKPVYISHVNGKQRISFCEIPFGGDWGGNYYETLVSAQITQP